MNPSFKTAANPEIPPVPLSEHGPETELWEPPFERWLRLADRLLGNDAAPDENTFPRRAEPSDFHFPRKI